MVQLITKDQEAIFDMLILHLKILTCWFFTLKSWSDVDLRAFGIKSLAFVELKNLEFAPSKDFIILLKKWILPAYPKGKVPH